MSNSIEESRELSALLDCSSYQGMTDEEIKKIITYKEGIAARNAVIKAATESHTRLMSELRERQERACAETAQSLKNALDAQARYERVADDE